MKKLFYLLILISTGMFSQSIPVGNIKAESVKISRTPTLTTGNTKQLVRNVSTGVIEEQTIVSGGGGGVSTVTAGTNVTITGTSTNPIVNATTIVDASETAAGKINLLDQTLGSGNKTIVGSSSTTGNAFEVQNLAHTKILEVMNSGDSKVNGIRLGTGNSNVASNLVFGNLALNANTSGISNTAIATNALNGNTTGIRNTAIGSASMYANIIGSKNTAIGVEALRNNAGNENVAIGDTSLFANTSGGYNVSIGSTALLSNTTGIENVGVGFAALSYNTTGLKNIGIGRSALGVCSSGSNNIAIGRYASVFASDGTTAITASNSSVFIGNETKALANNQTNQIVIGDSAIGKGSNTTQIGNSSTTKAFIAGALGVQVMTTTEKNAIASPTAGLMVFDTDLGALCTYSTMWNSFITSSALTPYLTSATASTTYQPIGSYLTSYTETDPLALKISNNLSDLPNTPTARINLGLGSLATQNGTFTAIPQTNVTNLVADLSNKLDNSTPQTKNVGNTTNTTPLLLTGSIDDFLQYDIKNTSTGNLAQSGYSASANNGTPTTKFMWMGKNNTGFNNPQTYNVGIANDGSLLNDGGDLWIHNTGTTGKIAFSTGKVTTPFYTERMAINSNGSIAFNGRVGVAGQFLQSNGTSSPTWVTPAEDNVILFSDFLNVATTANPPFAGASISSGTVLNSTVNLNSNRQGVVRMTSSTTAGGGYRWQTDVTSMRLGGKEVFTCGIAPVNFTTTTMYAGFHDSTTATSPIDGVYFKYSTTGAVSLETSNSSAKTTSATIATLSLNTWYKLKITINSDATSVLGEIFNSTGTLLGSSSIATNIPKTAGREVGAGIAITESTTTATAMLDLDFLRIQYFPIR